MGPEPIISTDWMELSFGIFCFLAVQAVIVIKKQIAQS